MLISFYLSLLSPNLIRNGSDEGLTLETSAFELPNGGQFTLSTQLVNLNFPVVAVWFRPIEAANHDAVLNAHLYSLFFSLQYKRRYCKLFN